LVRAKHGDGAGAVLLSPESVKIYTSLKTIYFHPKERISKIRNLLVDILTELNKPRWRKVLERVDAEFLSQFTPHQKRTYSTSEKDDDLILASRGVEEVKAKADKEIDAEICFSEAKKLKEIE
ncbi:MAG: hypothetical protein JRJ83_09250, partial [Deltaproteobacteria bacterium]|nr:hypothetical protein [Deltaproteobacteria bacterium]